MYIGNEGGEGKHSAKQKGEILDKDARDKDRTPSRLSCCLALKAFGFQAILGSNTLLGRHGRLARVGHRG